MLEVSVHQLSTKSNGSRLGHLRIISSRVSSGLISRNSMAATDAKDSSASQESASVGICGPCSPCSLTRDELKKRLTPLQYQITQEKGTERAFTGKFYKMKDDGMYSCVVCGEELFSSQTKYESGSGWPAFYDVTDQRKVKLKQDLSHGLVRTEVSCAKCQSHLGHVFDDGPKPSGKRFCINSAALDFSPVRDDSLQLTQEEEEEEKEESCQNGDISSSGAKTSAAPFHHPPASAMQRNGNSCQKLS